MMKTLKNERGATAFYTIWLFGLTALLLILIVNIINVYVVKGVASTSAEQAAIAATDAIYDEVNEAIDYYDQNTAPGTVHGLVHKSVREQIEEKKNEIRSNRPEVSESKAEREAIDYVLTEELPHHQSLENGIEQALADASTGIRSAVYEMVTSNNGEIYETEIIVFNNDLRIEIKTEAAFEGTGGMFQGMSENVPQKAVGPEVEFVSELNWNNQTLTFTP